MLALLLCVKPFQLVFGLWNERVVVELVGNRVFVIIKGVFGYDLDVSKEAAVPQTVADLYAQEFAAFLISLGPDALDDIPKRLSTRSILFPR